MVPTEARPDRATDDWRYEVKLVCPLEKLAVARTWIRLHPEALREAYPPRLVHSLYLDTPALNSFDANIAGISQRQKLRLRWYGPPQAQVVRPVLELKYKENMLGGKQRQPLDWVLDWQRPYAQLLPLLREAAGPDWHQWLAAATQPALLNQYQREYYAAPDGALRVTLDYALQAFDQQLSPRPNRQRPLLLPRTAIIEVKAPRTQAKRLEQAMAHFPLSRMRNSKYASGILAAL
ncbi:MAG: polyphosphate polymerase domain-containing protein [Chloroflexi bacterium]|nr:polyphosphate polymerase domain-containing protein [Chloroflexota bacterium]